MHRYHYSAGLAQAKNYVAVVTPWDLLLGTFYYRPGVIAQQLGAEHPAHYPQDRDLSMTGRYNHNIIAVVSA